LFSFDDTGKVKKARFDARHKTWVLNLALFSAYPVGIENGIAFVQLLEKGNLVLAIQYNAMLI
jgi:hypothetical protein